MPHVSYSSASYRNHPSSPQDLAQAQAALDDLADARAVGSLPPKLAPRVMEALGARGGGSGVRLVDVTAPLQAAVETFERDSTKHTSVVQASSYCRGARGQHQLCFDTRTACPLLPPAARPSGGPKGGSGGILGPLPRL